MTLLKGKIATTAILSMSQRYLCIYKRNINWLDVKTGRDTKKFFILKMHIFYFLSTLH